MMSSGDGVLGGEKGEGVWFLSGEVGGEGVLV